MTRGALLVIVLSALGACGDPVHDNEVNALGPEKNGIPPGPRHRAGQPCLVCHDGTGPGSPTFTVAGTVYAVKGEDAPYEGATVHLTDANGGTHDATTNDVGNFYITQDEWTPQAPIHVEITAGDVTATMSTHIGRDGSCASCHYDPPGPASPGRVYLVVDSTDLPGGGS